MHTLKTYIIEDSPVIRDSLVEALQELGPIAVVGVADGEHDALAWLQDPANACDLVIVDLFLRSGSGLGVLRAMRHAPRGPSLVVLSNYTGDEMRRTCLELGAVRVFDKSTEIEALLQYCTLLATRDAPPAMERPCPDARH